MYGDFLRLLDTVCNLLPAFSHTVSISLSVFCSWNPNWGVHPNPSLPSAPVPGISGCGRRCVESRASHRRLSDWGEPGRGRESDWWQPAASSSAAQGPTSCTKLFSVVKCFESWVIIAIEMSAAWMSWWKNVLQYNNSSRYMLSVLENVLTGSLLLTKIMGKMEVREKTH